MLVEHVNPYTHLRYRDDPAIFSWELANEPRYSPDDWIDGTAAYIKSLDPNHMVATGSEGAPPGEGDDFEKIHDGPDIDCATIHVWPQNWGFFDPADPSSYQGAEEMAPGYLSDRERAAAKLGKPLVPEEFGLARDWQPLHDVYDPRSLTKFRHRFYRAVYGVVERSVSENGPLEGDDFWAWAGAARPGSRWIGDPPHETAGWYSVYDTDRSTEAVISAHARAIAKAG
jgi:mannan endo-1,4-beta-mannosidase